MSFSVVLFDLDGTLIDTNDLIVKSFQYTLREKLGLELTAKEIYRNFGEPLMTSMERYAPGRGLELTEFYRVFNQANHDALVVAFEGVRAALETMKAAGVKLAVVTSKYRAMALRGLRVCGLDDLFDVIVGMDETDKHKPEPEPIYLALERLGEKPGAHVLMVGDSRFDLQCGANAGVKTAVVGWTVQDREELARTRPDHWVETTAELTKLVLGA
ncbi:MAG TPA: pyrophosphatase PpaX [Symbiobacteriaceae bacterium]|jgi:pyrophosphatase PpaX|nr:pyrophosphatase PpaX [Symbiobacteriaceae bacterium]